MRCAIADSRYNYQTLVSLRSLPSAYILPYVYHPLAAGQILDSNERFSFNSGQLCHESLRSLLSPIRTPGHSMLHLLIAMVRGRLSTIYRYIHIRSRYLAMSETCPGRGRSVMNTNALMSVSPHGLDSGQALLAASQYLNATAPYTACRNLPAPVS